MVPCRLARRAKEERQGAIVLREAGIGLPLKLAVDKNLNEVGAAHTGDVIPHVRRQGCGGFDFTLLAGGRRDHKSEDVIEADPGFAQIEPLKTAAASVLL